jgi:hypothetical protein
MSPRTLCHSSASRYARLLPLTIGVLTLAGCKEQTPAGPTAEVIAPTSARLSSAADQGWIRGSNFVDYEQFVPCLGEQVRVFGEVPYQYHSVATPSGGFNFDFAFAPVTPKTPQFYIQVISTGKLYTYNNGHPTKFQSGHVAAGEVFAVHDKEEYTAADGSKLFFSVTVHLTINANGVVTVSRQEVEDLSCA